MTDEISTQGTTDTAHPLPPWEEGCVRRVMAANVTGRDFVIGDLHGCLLLLRLLMIHVGFNPNTDRLFSVGDLVDRGSDSLGCLRLLGEPWFHCVQGNHEQMMAEWFTEPNGDSYWMHNGGGWVNAHRGRAEFDEVRVLAEAASRLPAMITVETAPGGRFHVIHAELCASTPILDGDFDDPLRLHDLTMAPTQWGREVVYWGRDVFEAVAYGSLDARTLARVGAEYGREQMQQVFGRLSTVYSGHSVVQAPVRFASLVNLDTGAYLTEWGDEPWAGLTMTEPLADRFWTAGRDGISEARPVRLQAGRAQ